MYDFDVDRETALLCEVGPRVVLELINEQPSWAVVCMLAAQAEGIIVPWLPIEDNGLAARCTLPWT